MSRVLVLYPIELLSQSKFERKVGKLISRLDDVCLLYIDDRHGYVEQYADDHKGRVTAESILAIQGADISHAIVFYDSETFVAERALLAQLGIPTRPLKLMITRVVNIKRETKYEGLKSTPEYEYIGRGSYWGNPYSMFESNDDGELDGRDEVIRKYKYDFDFDVFPNKEKSKVLELKGKRLGCFCKPSACHGDILADYLNSLDDDA